MAKLQLPDTGQTLGDPKATPSGLGVEGRKLWVQVTDEYIIDDTASAALLEMACRQLDRAAECGERIAKDGLTLKTRAGVKTHPLIQAEISCRNFVTRALTKLGILYEPVKQMGRPPGRGA